MTRLLVLLALCLPTAAAAQITPVDRIVAVVNKDVITATELDEAVDSAQRQLRRQGVAPPERAVLERQMLERLILDCSGLSDDERLNLLRLHLALGALGRPEEWRNADGTTKSLADFLGPRSAAILTTIDKLAGRADGTLATQYDAEFQKASDEAARADAKLQLAKAQLAALLGA